MGLFGGEKKDEKELLYANLVSKMIQIAYFHRSTFPEDDTAGRELLDTALKNPILYGMPLIKLNRIPVSMRDDQLKEYFEWLSTLPPYLAFTKGSLGFKLNGPTKNRAGIIVPRLADIFLTLSSVVLTPRQRSGNFKTIYKTLKNATAKNYVKYLETKSGSIYLGPGLNEWCGIYYLNYFAVLHVLSSVTSSGSISKQVAEMDKQLRELIKAKVINRENLTKLEAGIHNWAGFSLLG